MYISSALAVQRGPIMMFFLFFGYIILNGNEHWSTNSEIDVVATTPVCQSNNDEKQDSKCFFLILLIGNGETMPLATY